MTKAHRAGGIIARYSEVLSNEPLCINCRRSSTARRSYATAAVATAVAERSAPAPTSTANPTQTPTPTPSTHPSYALHAGILLSRAPTITRDLDSFEQAYFLYQRRLNERLALPFTRYFYFKKGTPADLEWKRKARDRKTPARDIGVYDAYGKTGWADEALVGAPEASPEWQVQALLKDAEVPAIGAQVTGAEDGVVDKAVVETAGVAKSDVDRPMPRQTEADTQKDFQSLDRLLQRTLYLLVKGKDGRWAFPSVQLLHKENLHQGAERAIVQAAGPNMNTWVVGNVPVGHYEYDFPKAVSRPEKQRMEVGEKIFYLKGRIMGGQANLTSNQLGLQEFRWLAKEEIQALVTPRFWSMTQDMLVDR